MLVLSVLLSTVVLLLAVMYAQFRWRQRHVLAAAAKLPCPPTLPILGNALLFIGGITSLTKNLTVFTKKFRQQFCIWIGPVPIFVLSDPSDIQIVLNNSNTLEKDEMYRFLRPFLGNGLVTAPVHIWKKYRRIIGPVLHPTKVEKFLPIFNDVSRQLVTNLDVGGKTVDPKRDLFNASMDAILRSVITKNPVGNEMNEDAMYLFSTVGEMLTLRLFNIWLHIDWIFNFFYRKELRKVTKTMNKCFGVFKMEWDREMNFRKDLPEPLQSQESERVSSKTMIDLSLLHPDDDQEDHLWRDEIFTMIAAGSDTVVTTLEFLLITLANHPDVQDKIYEEIQEVLGDSDRDLTVTDVKALKYLGYAIKESLRIHSTSPLLVKVATKDTKLSKSMLPAGSRFLLPFHALGWDAEHFPEPEKFIPERFSPEYQEQGQAERHKYAFLPFSGGPRNCIGKTYAMHIMKVMTVHILRKYKLTSQVRLEDIEYELKLIMISKTPLLLDLEPRTDVVV